MQIKANTKKMLTLAVLFCFALVSLLLIVVFIAHEDCCLEKPCPICPVLVKKRQLLEQFLMTVIVSLIICTAIFAVFSDLFKVCTSNIVEANVRMNN